MLFKWLNYSEIAMSEFREKLVFPTIKIFERKLRDVLKKCSDSGKKEEYFNILKKSISEKMTFEDNLNEFLRKINPIPNSSDRYGDIRIDDELPPRDAPLQSRKSNDQSFQEGSIQKKGSGAIHPNVPLLKLPISIHKDSNPTIISRSTRRNELMNKSSVSTSNRINNQLSNENNHMSREPSVRAERRISHSNEANMSYLDDGDGQVSQPTTFVNRNLAIAGRDNMNELARKMGEYFLSIDLGCLLENKRKNQLDEVAKLTGIKDEIKVIESIMLDSRVKEPPGMRGFGLGLGTLNPLGEQMERDKNEASKTGLVTDREREEIHSDDSLSESEKIEIIPQQKSAKSNLKRIQRAYSKSMKVLLNIIYQGLVHATYDDLQNYEQLISQIVIYLSTDLSLKTKDKEMQFVRFEITR